MAAAEKEEGQGDFDRDHNYIMRRSAGVWKGTDAKSMGDKGNGETM